MRGIEPEVILIEEDPAPAVARAPPARFSRLTSQAVGATATLLFHFLVTAPLLLGVSAHKARPRHPVGPGSVAWASQGSQYESMILLDLSALSAEQHSDQDAPDIKTDGIEIEELKLALASREIAPPPELRVEDAEEAETSNEAAGDPAGAAALFGRYMGQIAARIDRTWMRPRTVAANGRFDCKARIAQDTRGNIVSIELQDCGPEARWRESLISAIKRASPLSAPSEQWLFAEIVTLRFSADQYEPGRTPEYLYEPQVSRVAHTVAPVPAQEMPGGSEELELTIEGSGVKWTKKDNSAKTRR